MSDNGSGSPWVIGRAAVADAADILALQRIAYGSEQALYPASPVPAMRQTLSELEAEIVGQTVLKATAASDPAGRIAGSVRARRAGDVCLIGRLIVHPDVQGQGLGASLMAAVEACFPDVLRFEVFTGHRSARNLALYARVGLGRGTVS